MTAYLMPGDDLDLTLTRERNGIFDESIALYDKDGDEVAVFIGQQEVTLSTRVCPDRHAHVPQGHLRLALRKLRWRLLRR